MELGKVKANRRTVQDIADTWSLLAISDHGHETDTKIAAEVAKRCNAHDGLVEALAKFGTITPCKNCDGSGRNQHGSCCRITGHARECKCLVCQWKTAYYQLENKLNVLRVAGVHEGLVVALREAKRSLCWVANGDIDPTTIDGKMAVAICVARIDEALRAAGVEA